MNQAEFIDAVAEQTGVSKKDLKTILDAVGGVAHAELVDGGEVTLPGLGKLKTATKPARTGRNPATGDSIEIPAKTVVKFTVAKALKDAVA